MDLEDEEVVALVAEDEVVVEEVGSQEETMDHQNL